MMKMQMLRKKARQTCVGAEHLSANLRFQTMDFPRNNPIKLLMYYHMYILQGFDKV